MSPASGALRASAVSVSFGGVAALKGVDLELRSGEIVGLIGPNGAGKTTLMNILSGFIRPSSGRVWVGDQDVTTWLPHRRARLGIGRTFQSVKLYPRLTVRENVEANAVAAGAGRREARRRAAALLELFALGGCADVHAESLPHGEEHLVGIARALAMNPTFLLLDEPAAGLNEEETDVLTEAVRNVREEFGCGVLVIEHDMRLVMGLCERLQVLTFGETLRVGTPSEIQEDITVIEAYLGVAAEPSA